MFRNRVTPGGNNPRGGNPHHPERLAALEALRQLVGEMAGRKLPGERELSQRLTISRQHLRILLDQLEAEGVVQRRQGSGTYAVDARDSELTHVALLIDSRLKLGNDPFFSSLTERLQLGIQAAGIHCVVERIDGSSRPRFVGDGVICLGVAGVAAVSHLGPTDPPAVLLTEATVPRRYPDRVSLLLPEDYRAGCEAARRALAEGCRHLIFFGRGGLSSSRERLEGVQRAAAEFSDSREPVTVELHECAMNYSAGRLAALELAERFRDQEASEVGLIAANDWLAVGLRAGLAEVGLPLRRRAILSFDGLPIANDPALEIRSLHFPYSAVAEDAIAELRRLLHHPTGRIIRYPMEWADGWKGQVFGQVVGRSGER